MQAGDVIVIFKIGAHTEAVEAGKIKPYTEFSKVITKFIVIGGTIVVPELYDIFILYINYIRYGKILSKDVAMIELAIEVNDSKYKLSGFSELCKGVIDRLSTPICSDIHVNDNGCIITGSIIFDPMSGKSKPHNIWSLTTPEGKSMRCLVLEGKNLYCYTLNTPNPLPAIVQYSDLYVGNSEKKIISQTATPATPMSSQVPSPQIAQQPAQKSKEQFSIDALREYLLNDCENESTSDAQNIAGAQSPYSVLSAPNTQIEQNPRMQFDTNAIKQYLFKENETIEQISTHIHTVPQRGQGPPSKRQKTL
jgi:hypothetical protein